jgi:acyl-CoA synthetase (AMP-forming)/AMP-acid ligase II
MRNTVASYFETIINEIPGERIYLENSEEKISYQNLKDMVRRFKDKHSNLKGSNCAITSYSRFELAKFIPLISSLANRVFLQPEGLTEEVVENFYKTSSIDLIIEIKKSGVEFRPLTDSKQCPDNTTNQQLLLCTSGTTGTPKLAAYNVESLAQASIKDVAKGRNFKWALSYDLNRFAGLQVFLQVILSGSALVVIEPHQELPEIINLLIGSNVNSLSATPSFWRKILMTPNSGLIPFKTITLGGEISDQKILDSLCTQYPNARITHIYASTEAGVGFAVKDGKEGFPLTYVTPGFLSSVDLKVVNSELWIKTPQSESVEISSEIEMDNSGFINTGDLVQIGNDRVYFKGRKSGVINVGGNKVTPEEIETILNYHPAVILSKVYGRKNSLMGMVVCAEVITRNVLPSSERSLLKKELNKYCRKKLVPYQVPAIIKFVDVIEVNNSGKIVRNK